MFHFGSAKPPKLLNVKCGGYHLKQGGAEGTTHGKWDLTHSMGMGFGNS